MAGFDSKRFRELMGGEGSRDDEEYESGKVYYRTGPDGRIEKRLIRDRRSLGSVVDRMFD
ncbi:MAG: hypothetical protein RIM72_00355 [Alphaproteobacteria bacterium]